MLSILLPPVVRDFAVSPTYEGSVQAGQFSVIIFSQTGQFWVIKNTWHQFRFRPGQPQQLAQGYPAWSALSDQASAGKTCPGYPGGSF
jgi:hypothetical protein